MYHRLSKCTLVVCALALAAPAIADINLVSTALSNRVENSTGFGATHTNYPSSLPIDTNTTTSHSGASSQAFYKFTAAGDTGAFEFDFIHIRLGGAVPSLRALG